MGHAESNVAPPAVSVSRAFPPPLRQAKGGQCRARGLVSPPPPELVSRRRTRIDAQNRRPSRGWGTRRRLIAADHPSLTPPGGTQPTGLWPMVGGSPRWQPPVRRGVPNPRLGQVGSPCQAEGVTAPRRRPQAAGSRLPGKGQGRHTPPTAGHPTHQAALQPRGLGPVAAWRSEGRPWTRKASVVRAANRFNKLQLTLGVMMRIRLSQGRHPRPARVPGLRRSPSRPVRRICLACRAGL